MATGELSSFACHSLIAVLLENLEYVKFKSWKKHFLCI